MKSAGLWPSIDYGDAKIRLLVWPRHLLASLTMTIFAVTFRFQYSFSIQKHLHVFTGTWHERSNINLQHSWHNLNFSGTLTSMFSTTKSHRYFQCASRFSGRIILPLSMCSKMHFDALRLSHRHGAPCHSLCSPFKVTVRSCLCQCAGSCLRS